MISVDQADSVTCAVLVDADLTGSGSKLFAGSGLDKDSASKVALASVDGVSLAADSKMIAADGPSVGASDAARVWTLAPDSAVPSQ